jgi:hypothetical protein
LGVFVTTRESLVPDLRSSKIEGQSNFVNPGLLLLNSGADFEVTPKLRLINNVNFLWFDSVEVLRIFIFHVCADAGLVVVSLVDPKQPRVTAVVGDPNVHQAHAIQAQFRYAYLCDHEGILDNGTRQSHRFCCFSSGG